jgi:serine/threonine protein phosphatase PrpC
VNGEPDVIFTDLCPSDLFLMVCCDGVYDALDEQEVHATCMQFMNTRTSAGEWWIFAKF